MIYSLKVFETISDKISESNVGGVMKTYAGLTVPGSHASRIVYFLHNANASFSMKAIDSTHLYLMVELPNTNRFAVIKDLVSDIAESCKAQQIEVTYED